MSDGRFHARARKADKLSAPGLGDAPGAAFNGRKHGIHRSAHILAEFFQLALSLGKTVVIAARLGFAAQGVGFGLGGPQYFLGFGRGFRPHPVQIFGFSAHGPGEGRPPCLHLLKGGFHGRARSHENGAPRAAALLTRQRHLRLRELWRCDLRLPACAPCARYSAGRLPHRKVWWVP